MSNYLKISDVLPELEKEINKKAKAIKPIGPRSRKSKKRAYTLLLIENYTEVVLILKRILSTLTRLNEIHNLIFPPQSQDRQPLSQSEVQALTKDQFNLVGFLPVDMKCLYLWTAQITDIITKTGVRIDLQELKRISLFRHNFITHIHETPFFESSVSTQPGTMFNPGLEDVTIMFHSFFYSKSKFAGFNSLVKKAVLYIPELATERNVWQQLYILYRQFNKITDHDLQRNVKKIVFKIGNATESPGIIANALLTALKNYR